MKLNQSNSTQLNFYRDIQHLMIKKKKKKKKKEKKKKIADIWTRK